MDKSKFTKYNIITYSEVDIVLEVTPGTHRVTRGPGSILSPPDSNTQYTSLKVYTMGNST